MKKQDFRPRQNRRQFKVYNIRHKKTLMTKNQRLMKMDNQRQPITA